MVFQDASPRHVAVGRGLPVRSGDRNQMLTRRIVGELRFSSGVVGQLDESAVGVVVQQEPIAVRLDHGDQSPLSIVSGQDAVPIGVVESSGTCRWPGIASAAPLCSVNKNSPSGSAVNRP